MKRRVLLAAGLAAVSIAKVNPQHFKGFRARADADAGAALEGGMRSSLALSAAVAAAAAAASKGAASQTPRAALLAHLFPVLAAAADGHWHETIRTLAAAVLDLRALVETVSRASSTGLATVRGASLVAHSVAHSVARGHSPRSAV